MKRRPSEEVLDWEELENAPNTRGAFSFLKPQAPVINIQEHRQSSGANASELPHSFWDKPSTVGIMPKVPDEALDCITSTEDGMRENPAIPAEAQSKTKAERPYRIHKCGRVQDAHSHGENQLYAALWRIGKADSLESKVITIGWDRMARASTMSDKAAKRNTLSLIAKLAVDLISLEDSGSGTGKTYRVHSFKAILERRKAAGLEFVVKDKGVRFVGRPGSDSLPKIAGAPPRDITSTVDISSPRTADITYTVRGDKTSRDTVDKTSTPLGSLLVRDKKTTTKEDVSALLEALSSYVVADELAARNIVIDCRKVCHDVLMDEIVSVVHLKALGIIRNRTIGNPLGLMVRAIPQCFSGSGAAQLRVQWAMEKKNEVLRMQEQARQEADVRAWLQAEQCRCERILSNPSASVEERTKAERDLNRYLNH